MKIRIGSRVFHRKTGKIGHVENSNRRMYRIALPGPEGCYSHSVWWLKQNTGAVKVGKPAEATGHKKLPKEKMIDGYQS